MMPDNNETSDNAANGSAEDVQNTATASTVSQPDSSGLGSGDQTNPAQSGVKPLQDAQAHSGEGSAVSGIDGSSSAADQDANDPLNFGDQRMQDNDEPLSEVDQLRVQLAAAEAKASENWDRLLRLQAEMENQRKRAQNDVTKARKFALEGIVGDLLPVKDSLEMGLAVADGEDASPQSIIEGAELTVKMLAQVFEKNNILEVNPVDEKFDPEFHQAMSMQEVEGKVPNTVTAVMQKGYTLNDRLVRPALVMVAK